MASRAGLNKKAELLKGAPKIYKATAQSDWQRLCLYVELTEQTEEDVLEWIPMTLDDELFLIYKQTAEREKVKSLTEAWDLIARLVGVKQITYREFGTRCWAQGRETLEAYAADLENMAVLLKIPEELTKTRYLDGLPKDLSAKVTLLTEEEDKLERMIRITKKLTKEDNSMETLAVLKSNDIKSGECSELQRIEMLVNDLSEKVNALRTGVYRDHQRDPNNDGGCFKCGRPGHYARNCPTLQLCAKCGRRGHNIRDCRLKMEESNQNYWRQSNSKNFRGPVDRPAKY